MTRSTLQIEVGSDTRRVPPATRRWLASNLKKLARLADVTAGTLNIRIVEDETMAEFHWQYTGVLGTTDVLTFDLVDSEDELAHETEDEASQRPIEADIMVCVDEATRQAKALNHDVRMELLLYCLHGLLHLLGYDDHSKAGYAAMHKREDQLLAAAGFEPVFKKK